MCNAAARWAISQTIPMRDKMVLTVLALHTGPDGECAPSMAVLTSEASLSERSVQEAMRALIGSGLVSVTSGGGRSKTNTYRLETPQTAHETPQSTAETPQITTETPQIGAETPQTAQFTIEPSSPPPSSPSLPPIPPLTTPPSTSPTQPTDARDLFRDESSPINTKSKSKTKPRTTCPSNWTPSPDGVAYATSKGVDLAEVERFRDYHIARGNLMADWSGAWRTWCQNQQRFAAEKRPSTQTPIRPYAKPNHGDTMREFLRIVTTRKEQDGPPPGHPAGMEIDGEFSYAD